MRNYVRKTIMIRKYFFKTELTFKEILKRDKRVCKSSWHFQGVIKCPKIYRDCSCRTSRECRTEVIGRKLGALSFIFIFNKGATQGQSPTSQAASFTVVYQSWGVSLYFLPDNYIKKNIWFLSLSFMSLEVCLYTWFMYLKLNINRELR